eukprot:SAG31_NODE_302_length_18087_cov_97.056982_17_plen_66_part_00
MTPVYVRGAYAWATERLRERWQRPHGAAGWQAHADPADVCCLPLLASGGVTTLRTARPAGDDKRG